VFRAGLLAVFVTHVYTTVTLARVNRAARPIAYRRYSPHATSFASRYMLLSGLVILAFVAYHLLHFTFGIIDPANTRLIDAQQRLDVYSSVVLSFQSPLIAWTYVGAMLLLGLHLWHGMASTFQTFGVHHESYETLVRVTSIALIAALVIGNCSIPILILAGKVRLGAT
jgi:succinate dehydrogenase cytochrome b subunit